MSLRGPPLCVTEAEKTLSRRGPKGFKKKMAESAGRFSVSQCTELPEGQAQPLTMTRERVFCSPEFDSIQKPKSQKR